MQLGLLIYPLEGYWPNSWNDFRTFPSALTLTFIVMACIWAADNWGVHYG